MKIKEMLAGKTDNTFIQFFRYIFVGGAATVVDWGSSALLFYVVFGGKYAVAANVISFVLGLVTNFLISTVWVFNGSKVKSKIAEFAGFAAIGVVGLLITAGVTSLFDYLLADTTSLYQLIAKVASTAISFFWNFFARKYLLYNNKSDDGENN